jgi:hypothetical protein
VLIDEVIRARWSDTAEGVRLIPGGEAVRDNPSSRRPSADRGAPIPPHPARDDLVRVAEEALPPQFAIAVSAKDRLEEWGCPLPFQPRSNSRRRAALPRFL